MVKSALNFIEIARHPEMRFRQFADVCCRNSGLLRHWLDLQNSCLLDILKTAL